MTYWRNERENDYFDPSQVKKQLSDFEIKIGSN